MPEPPVQLESFNKSASLEPFKHFSQFRIQEGLLLPAFSVDGDGQAQLPPAAPPTLREFNCSLTMNNLQTVVLMKLAI